MLRNYRLRSVNYIVSGLFAVAGLCLAGLLIYTVQSLRDVEESWSHYQADRSDKARLESVLRASIGYGGMIHGFKNYVLRHDEELMEKVQADIGAAKAIIAQYLSLGTTEAEKVALQDIGAALNSYGEALETTWDLIRMEISPQEIDAEVIIDDTAALRGLSTLRNEIQRQSGLEETPHDVKGRVAANLRAALGYGGMIHEFKNLVLRHDLPRVEKVRRKIAEIREILNIYETIGPTTAEAIAIEDIRATILDYEFHLSHAVELIGQGASVEEIDDAVKVSDAKALRGLATLDREISLQIGILARKVGSDLNFLANVVPLANWAIIAVIFFAVGLSIWIFNTFVIRPIATTTAIMKTLALDQTDVEIGHLRRRNEIGQMARALEKFRENIVNKQKAEKEILDLAMTDSLTGLGNRHRFDQRIKEAIDDAERSKTTVACMMIDLDKFKPINDQYGHAAGDEVLKTVARRLLHVTRKTDFVARLGGDEFVVISTAISDLNSVEIPAKRIVDQLGLPMYLEEGDVRIGGSIGISIYPIDTIDLEELVKNADKALYAAKEAGRNTFQFYNASMN